MPRNLSWRTKVQPIGSILMLCCRHITTDLRVYDCTDPLHVSIVLARIQGLVDLAPELLMVSLGPRGYDLRVQARSLGAIGGLKEGLVH